MLACLKNLWSLLVKCPIGDVKVGAVQSRVLIVTFPGGFSVCPGSSSARFFADHATLSATCPVAVVGRSFVFCHVSYGGGREGSNL